MRKFANMVGLRFNRQSCTYIASSVREHTTSGSMMENDVLIQCSGAFFFLHPSQFNGGRLTTPFVLVPSLPLGGIGPSGCTLGSYSFWHHCTQYCYRQMALIKANTHSTRLPTKGLSCALRTGKFVSCFVHYTRC